MKYDIELLKTQLLPDFPSGSSISYRDDMLYLVGDDANSVLILDRDYLKINSLQLFNYPGKRIPKHMKTDLEAAVFITISDVDYLLLVGSSSTEQREKVILIPFAQSRLNKTQALTISTKTFIDRLRSQGVPEVNVEGATVIGENLVFSNRSNRTHTTNYIILTTLEFWKNQPEAALNIIPVRIPAANDDIIGISEICYQKKTDTLLISFSSEHTSNAYDDGVIGDSYLGWIGNMTQKIKEPLLTVDHMINLRQVHPDFNGEKIEGLCVESANAEEMIIHLISDNDEGQSRLFKIRLKISD